MAKGNEVPAYEKGNYKDFGDVSAFAENLMNSGLPESLKKDLLKQTQGGIAGQLRSGEQNLREANAGSGGPAGSYLAGLTSMNANANKSLSDFNTNLAGQDFNARQTGFRSIMDLINLSQGEAGQKNQYNMNKYQIDEANTFKWGDFLGNLFGAGGSVLGGYLGGRNNRGGG